MLNVLRRFVCNLTGHRPRVFRKLEACGHGQALTVGWVCDRCGYQRWRLTLVGLTQREFARARHVVEQAEAKYGLNLDAKTIWENAP